MQYLFHAGATLFVIGLIGSHIVTFATRGPKRSSKPMKRSLRVMMWGSVGAVILGFLLCGISFIHGWGWI